jgi:hypothetical protein
MGLGNDVRANDIAQDQGDKKSKRSVNPLLKKRVRTHECEIDHVENEKSKWANYSYYIAIFHAAPRFRDMCTIISFPEDMLLIS